MHVLELSLDLRFDGCRGVRLSVPDGFEHGRNGFLDHGGHRHRHGHDADALRFYFWRGASRKQKCRGKELRNKTARGNVMARPRNSFMMTEPGCFPQLLSSIRYPRHSVKKTVRPERFS